MPAICRMGSSNLWKRCSPRPKKCSHDKNRCPRKLLVVESEKQEALRRIAESQGRPISVAPLPGYIRSAEEIPRPGSEGDAARLLLIGFAGESASRRR